MLATEEHFQLGPPLGEAFQDFVYRQLLAVFLMETDFLKNQVGGGLGMIPQFGIPGQKVFGPNTAALLPDLNHFLHQFRGQSQCFRLGQGGTAQQPNGRLAVVRTREKGTHEGILGNPQRTVKPRYYAKASRRARVRRMRRILSLCRPVRAAISAREWPCRLRRRIS